jgi:hypothetical protein
MAGSAELISDSEDDAVLIEDSNDGAEQSTRSHKRRHIDVDRAPVFRKSMREGARCGLSGKEFRALRRFGSPVLLYMLLQAMVIQFGRVDQDVRMCEFFSGVGELASAARRRQWGALTFDWDDDNRYQDFESPYGLHEGLLMMMRCCPQSLVSWGTPCSLWVWMSRSVSQRSASCPMGNEARQCVRSSNLQVSRMCLPMLLGFAKLCVMLLEQPRSSLMGLHSRMRQAPYADLWCSSTWMGAFDNSMTAKCTSLFSNQIIILSTVR